jgi:hypothetical protein
MTFVVSAVGGLLGAGMQANAAESAGAAQAGATRYAADLQKQMFDIQNEQYKPYREAGYGALKRVGELLPSLTTPVTEAEITGLPGFNFAIKQGVGAARQTANVGGGGSNVDRAAQKFAIDYTLGTAMPQVLAQRSNIYNTLAGIAGIGQVAQGQTGQMAQNVASNIGQAAIGGATALGAGNIGAANAYAGAINNASNQYMMYRLMKG